MIRTTIKNTVERCCCWSAVLVALLLSSCLGEAKEKLKQAKQGISNTASIVQGAQEAKEDIEKLKDVTPLTNEELKQWLPESLNGWQRSGFSVGKTGYMNVASIEGDFTKEITDESDNATGKDIKQKFSVSIVDGAGPTGSMLIAGLGMAGKMDVEEENQYKHTKGVTVEGIKARQTYHKKRKEMALQFVYEKRFGVMVNGVNMDADETWAMIKKLDLDELVEMSE